MTKQKPFSVASETFETEAEAIEYAQNLVKDAPVFVRKLVAIVRPKKNTVVERVG